MNKRNLDSFVRFHLFLVSDCHLYQPNREYVRDRMSVVFHRIGEFLCAIIGVDARIEAPICNLRVWETNVLLAL